MAQVSKFLRSVAGQQLMYWCQGCEQPHSISFAPGHWEWSGDLEKPTFSPSVLVRGGHYAESFKPGDACWCTYNAEAPPAERTRFKCGRCHTFIRNGMVEFLSDCTHQFAGQTLPLPDLPPHMQDQREPEPAPVVHDRAWLLAEIRRRTS
jgi:hypothetical protein